MDIESVALLVNSRDDIFECTRSGLGLAVDGFSVGVFIIGAGLGQDCRTKEFSERLEMLDDLDGKIFTSNEDDAENNDFIQFTPLPEMVRKITGYDLITTF